MRLILLCLFVMACGPGFGIDAPADGGLDLDAAVSTDAGIPEAVLAQVNSCEEVFETRYQHFDFETEIGALVFSFGAEIADGSLRLAPRSDNVRGGYNNFFSMAMYRSLGTCIDALTPAPESAREMTFAGKAHAEGASCVLDLSEHILTMYDVQSNAAVGQVDVPWAGEQLEVRMFTYNDETTNICEIMRLDNREVLRIESDDVVPTDSMHVEMYIYGDGDAAHALIRDVSTGIPHERFRRLSP